MRQIDFRTKTLSRENIIAAFQRIWAELGSLGMPCGAGDFLSLQPKHLGADLNTAIDKAHAAIAILAIILGKTSTGSRVEDFRTGTHDVRRLHVELDRIHTRIAALGTASIPNDMIGKGPLGFVRTGSASYVTTSGAFATAGDGVPRFGVPGPVVRRNLLKDASLAASTWTKRGTCTVASNGLVSGIGADGVNDVYCYTGIVMPVDSRIEPSITLQNISGGVLQMRNSGGIARGLWLIDLSKVSSSVGERITRSHPAVTITNEFTSTGTTSHGLLFSRVSGPSSLSAVITDAQFDAGPASTPDQPTVNNAVDLTNPINGAGIVLEGATRNYVTYSGFQQHVNVTNGTSSIVKATHNIDGRSALGVTWIQGPTSEIVNVVPVIDTSVISSAAGKVLTISMLAYSNKVGALGKSNIRATVDGVEYFLSQDGTSWSTMAPAGEPAVVTTTVSNTWHVVTLKLPSFPVGTLTGFSLQGLYRSTSDFVLKLADIQIEEGYFRTSLMETNGASVARPADMCAISNPGNELAKSHDLTASPWAKSAGCTVARDANGRNLVTLAATTDYLQQAHTATSGIASTTRTIAVRLMLPSSSAISGSVRLRLLDQAGNQIASTTINTTSLSTTEARTFPVTGTAAADDTGVIAQLIGNSGTGGIIVEAMGMVPGSFPVILRTEDTPIIPSGVVVEPSWWENGKLTGSFVLPVGANTAAGTVILGKADELELKQYASNVVLQRKSNGRVVSVDVAINAANGIKHTFSASWKADMTISLTVDGTTSTRDAMALYGDTSWSTHERLWLSSGSTFATLSDVKPGNN